MKTLRCGMIALLAWGTLLFGVHSTGASQAGDVPRELALGILKGMYQPAGAAEPEILVGAIPADLIAEIYVPEAATIHGSVVRAAGTIVIATVQLPADEVKAAYRREMPSRGWSLSEQFDRIGPATQPAGSASITDATARAHRVGLLAARRSGHSYGSISVGCRTQRVRRSRPADVWVRGARDCRRAA